MTLTIDVIRALFLDHCHRRTLISFLEPRTIFVFDLFEKRRGKEKEKERDRIFRFTSLDKGRSFLASNRSLVSLSLSVGEKIVGTIDVTSVVNRS